MSSTLINNVWQDGEGESFISSTPDETAVLWQKSASSPTQVQNAVACARKAFPEWAGSALSTRIDIIQRFADILTRDQDSIARAISLETGKPLWEARTEVSAMVNKVAISIRAQHERAGVLTKNHLSLAHRAHGVMAVFGPFNFPGHLPNGHIVPALLAGNCVIFKPSELTPWVAELTVQAWLDAGLPPGVINLLQGGKTTGQTLVDADVDGILFTGSHPTGSAIHRQVAGRPEVLLALELGGNNPLILGATAAPEVAAGIILHSAFLSAGQRCTCARRLIMLDSPDHQAVLETLVDLCARVIIGKNEETPFMGPVINTATATQLLTYQQTLIDKGATVHAQLRPQDASGVYLSPGIIDVTAISDIADEEHFGPLLQIYRVSSSQEALSLANATRYGLAAGLISDSRDEQRQFVDGIRAGVISINAPTAGASSELPFGGVGASGNHRPSAYYAADYCAWPQALTTGKSNIAQAETFNPATIRGLR